MDNNPVEISVNPANQTATTVEQSIYPADQKQKAPMLLKLIEDNDWQQVLVFSKTKHGANRLSRFLDEKGITSAAIHGNKSQGARTKALENFKTGEIRVLVATDIAARGIDIAQLPQVVNFDLPHVSEDYVHRIGRTGRAGATGKAISLVCIDEVHDLFSIERLIKQVLPRMELEGFKVVNTLPASNLDMRPMKPKKPKKPSARTGHSDGQRSSDNARGHKPVSKNRRHTGTAKPATTSNDGAQASGSRSDAPRPNSPPRSGPANGAKPAPRRNPKNNGSNFSSN